MHVRDVGPFEPGRGHVKIWALVEEHCGDCGQIRGVFASEELAEAAQAAMHWPNDYRIEEWEVSS